MGEHYQELKRVYKEEGLARALEFDLAETIQRGYVSTVGVFALSVIGAYALSAGIESVATSQTLLETFQNPNAVKGAFAGGFAGSSVSLYVMDRGL
jgi:hypothetical protein